MITTSPPVQHGYVRYAHDGIIQYHIVQCHSAADGYSLGYGLRLMHEANYRSIAMPIRVATQRALRKHVSTDRHKRRKGDILDFHFFSRASSAVLGLRSNKAAPPIPTKRRPACPILIDHGMGPRSRAPARRSAWPLAP